MAIVAKGSDKARELTPVGNYFGVVIGVYDIGTHDSDFGSKRQVVIEIELHKKSGAVRTKDGDVLTHAVFANLTTGKDSTLRKFLEGILGRVLTPAEVKDGYDVTQLAEQPGRFRVNHVEKKKGEGLKAELVAMPLDDDDPKPRAVSDVAVYDTLPAEPGSDVPEWVAKKIRESQEYQARGGGGGGGNGNGKAAKTAATSDDDEIPF
jgi:hypothetical protein